MPCVDDSVQLKDKSYPVYEDIDKNETNYEVIDHSSDSEDDCELPAADKSHGNRELEDPPPLPPKRGTKVQASKEQDELPSLPPRSLPVKRVRKHRLLASREGQGREEKEETNELENEDKDGEMADQDAGVYESINYHSSDDESKGMLLVFTTYSTTTLVGRGPTSHEKREVGCQAYTQFCSGARISAAPIRLQYFKRLVHTSLAASQMKYRC